jgi:AcrR family transcriptional regulator
VARADTKQRLVEGALEAVRRHGVAGVSARTIAAAAGVNQALVFYHFGSVDELLNAACRAGTEARVATYRERFREVRSIRELLRLGRELYGAERGLGNDTVLTQMLAGAQADPRLAQATARALRLWIEEIELALRRLLVGSPLSAVVDAAGLARAVAAGFVGVQLFSAVDEDGGQRALSALEQLAVLVDVVEDLGPAGRRLLRSRVNRAARGS